MPTPESPFPTGSTDQEKHDIVRYAFDRRSEFPDATTIGDVIVRLEQKQLRTPLDIPMDDIGLITSDRETGVVTLPPSILSALERGFSDPIVMAREGAAQRRAIARNTQQSEQL